MTHVEGAVDLVAGPHDFVLAFFENAGGAALKVMWTPTPGAPLGALTNDVLTNEIGCGQRAPGTCVVNDFIDAPTSLGNDFQVIDCATNPDCDGHMSKTSRDIRSGNPHETSMLRLPTMAVSSPIRQLTFCYEYVVGYGSYGANVPTGVTGPSFTVSIVDEASGAATVVYQSPELMLFDYDTCNANGGWGDDTIVGDGCYSPPVCPNVPVDASTQEFHVLFSFTNNDRNMHLNEDAMNMQIGLCGTGDCNWQAVPSALGADFFMGPSCNDADGACTPVPPEGVAMRDGYDGAGGPSSTGRDIRSGNPHFTNIVQLSPVSTSVPPSRVSFSYSYVVGYGNYGAVVPAGTTLPTFTLGLVDSVTGVETIVYTSPDLSGYDYDTCGDHGGWGNDDDVTDGCYSPLVSVDVAVAGFTGTEFVPRFTMRNNDRNFHLNEDGMEMVVAVCPSGDTSTLVPPPPPPPAPVNHPVWPIAPPPAGPFHCGTGGPDTDDPSTDGYDYCGDNTVCPCGRCCYCDCDVPPPCTPSWYQYNPNSLTSVQAEQACRAQGGHLASFHGPADQAAVEAMIPPGTAVWIGMHADDSAQRVCGTGAGRSFSYFDGTPTTDFAHWGTNEPDNDGGSEVTPCAQSCVQMGAIETDAAGAIGISRMWSDEDCGVSAPYVCGFCDTVTRPPPPPAVPPPPPPTIPDREVLVPRCAKAGRPEAWGVVDNFWIDDGSGMAPEATTFKLCWTTSYLRIQAEAIDTDIFSNQPNCGDSTWNGDSLEFFLAPGEAEPNAWMEMDISAAGGMYFAAIHGNGGYGGAERLGTATPAGQQCNIDGLTYTTDGAAQCAGGPCYTYTMQVPFRAFNMNVFDDDKAQYPENPPRVWRANFYRTNFIGGQQRNPTDFYAWHPSVALGSGASFHVPGQFGTMRLVDSANGGGGH